MQFDIISSSCTGLKPEIVIEVIEQLPAIIKARVNEVLRMQELANKGDKNAQDKYANSNCHTIANYIGLGWIHLGENHFPRHGFDFLSYWNSSPLKDTKSSLDNVQMPAIARMKVVGDSRLLHSFIVLGKKGDDIICIDNCHRREDGKSIQITTHNECAEGYIKRYNDDVGYSSMISGRLGEGICSGSMYLKSDEKMLFYKPINMKNQKETSLSL